MIIQCQSCSRKFVVKDNDIPEQGRTVKCGYCSVTWHQMPVLVTKKEIIKKTIKFTCLVILFLKLSVSPNKISK